MSIYTSIKQFHLPIEVNFHPKGRSFSVKNSSLRAVCIPCLLYTSRPRVKEIYSLDVSPESAAIVALLHDICKINIYKRSTRNVKDDNGVWQKVPCYEFDDQLPYGHGEKSVYIISGFMRLTREEAFAIRYHMGFSGPEDPRSVGASFERFPLAFALATADMEATYFLEGKE